MRNAKKLVTLLSGVGEKYEAPAYANTGGTGDRTASITVSVDEAATTFWRSFGTNVSVRQGMVDGGKVGAPYDYVNNALAVANRWMEFNFTAKKLITEVKFYVTAAFADCGVWKWQGYNGATWEDVGSSFTLGVTGVSGLTQTITTLSGNAKGYTKYRMIGVSGNSNFNMYYWVEFEFKIGSLL